MTTRWVFKHNGSIQCDPNSRPIPLEEMRRELEEIIGAGNVLAMEERSLFVIELCGMPTGAVNAYEITEEGWQLLTTGTVGRRGFYDWPDSERATGQAAENQPERIEDLVGHPIRVYQTGDGITLDFRPDRFNVETDESQRIVRVWFG